MKTLKGMKTPVRLDSDSSENSDELDAEKIHLNDGQRFALDDLGESEKDKTETKSDNFSEFYENINAGILRE